jgi:hypothetical protein
MGNRLLRALIEPLIKAVNHSHLFPTRYALELKYSRGAASSDTISEPPQREDAKKTIRRAIIKPLIKAVNHSHLFPMQYALESEYSCGVASSDTINEPIQRDHVSKTIKRSTSETLHQSCH